MLAGSYLYCIMPDSILDKSMMEFTKPLRRLLSELMMVNSLPCFSVSVPPTPSRSRLAPSLIEVRGVLNSWDIMEKKSAFNRSKSLSR